MSIKTIIENIQKTDTLLYEKLIETFDIDNSGKVLKAYKKNAKVKIPVRDLKLWINEYVLVPAVLQNVSNNINSNHTNIDLSEFNIIISDNKIDRNSIRSFGYDGSDCSVDDFLSWMLDKLRIKNDCYYKLVPIIIKISSKYISSDYIEFSVHTISIKDRIQVPTSKSDTSFIDNITVYRYNDTDSKSVKQNIWTYTLYSFLISKMKFDLLDISFETEYSYFYDGRYNRIRFDAVIVQNSTNQIICAFNFHEKTNLHKTSEAFENDRAIQDICLLSEIPLFIMREENSFESTMSGIYLDICKAIIGNTSGLEEEYKILRIYEEMPDQKIDYNQIRYLFLLYNGSRTKPNVSLRELFSYLIIQDKDELDMKFDSESLLELFLENETVKEENIDYIRILQGDILIDIIFCYKDITDICLDLLTIFPIMRCFIKIFEQLANVSHSLLTKESKTIKINKINKSTATVNVWKLAFSRALETTHHYKASILVENLTKIIDNVYPEVKQYGNQLLNIKKYIINQISEKELIKSLLE